MTQPRRPIAQRAKALRADHTRKGMLSMHENTNSAVTSSAVTSIRAKNAQNIAIVSTFPPRACGLATFASDLADSLLQASSVASVGIVEITRRSDSFNVAAVTSNGAAPWSGNIERVAEIQDDDVSTYRSAARATNAWADVVLVQHEFGIFGGHDGKYLLEFLEELTVPFIVTLHTVLPHFSSHQHEVLKQVCANASLITVFTSTASRLMVGHGAVDESRVAVVPHGAPSAIYDADSNSSRLSLGLCDRFVLSSFGLVSAGKGLELAIEALPMISEALPNVHLIIAGRTHPDVVRRDGEAYRDSLSQLAEDLDVFSHVTFLDGFLGIDAIAELLAATDIFVTPYVNLDQIVSGALTFALASGCPVVSTPYLYAVDQLADGAGRIVGGRSASAFAAAVTELSEEPGLSVARQHSTQIGQSMRWSAVGERLASLAVQVFLEWHGEQDELNRRFAVKTETTQGARTTVPPAPPVVIPLVELSQMDTSLPTRHLQRLVDDRGIIQHATGVVPLLASGYCVDDIARLIPVALVRSRSGRSTTVCNYWESALTKSIAVVMDSHLAGSANMRNFMSWTGTWVDQPHFGDHVGRALLGLASLPNTPDYMTVVRPLVSDVLSYWPDDSGLHPDAYALIAQAKAPHLANKDTARRMLDRLVGACRDSSSAKWCWPESTVRYDQGRFPQALILGGSLLGDKQAIAMGLAVLTWLTQQCDQESYLRFPGHRGWQRSEPLQWSGDEQPLEALAYIEAHRCAYQIDGDAYHVKAAHRGLDWFYGANRLGQSLADPKTGACFDGLGSFDVNRNCGAESTLALAHAHIQIAEIQRHFHPTSRPHSFQVVERHSIESV